MRMNKIFALCIMVVAIWSCKNDDDETVDIDLQDLGDTAMENDEEIQAYLATHFYTLVGTEVVLDTIADGNAGQTPLAQLVSEKIISFTPSDFGLEEDDDSSVDHTLYYLVIEEGLDEDANFVTQVDSTYISYTGLDLEGNVFDASTGAPVWFDLNGNPLFGTSGTVRGFTEGLTEFKESGAVVENGDGTFEVENPSIGLIIMPSTLAYFSSSTTGESYAPIIFTFNVVRTLNADHDADGIPTILEGRDGSDGYTDEDIEVDSDEDGIPNYIDVDDDGDGILTIDEDLEPDQDLLVDRDGDGDPTNDIGDGDPTNDFTDGIPNYLNPNATASRDDED